MFRICGSTTAWSSGSVANIRWVSSSLPLSNANTIHVAHVTKTNLQRLCHHRLPKQNPPSRSIASPSRPRVRFAQSHRQPQQQRATGFRPYASQTTTTTKTMAMGIRTVRPNASLYTRQFSLYGGSLFGVSIGLGWAWTKQAMPTHVSNCDGLMVVVGGDEKDDSVLVARRPSIRMRDLNEEDETLWSRIKRLLRMIRRLLKLALVFTPVVALYPLHWITSHSRLALLGNGDETPSTTDAHQLALQSMSSDAASSSFYVGWYYRLCLLCVEWSGAACIKIMQWAGSRPDMFGRDFCAVFSKLQDSTRPHAWKHTERAMVDAFGENWEEKIRLDGILGSGCIAQVYKGVILDGGSNEDEDDDHYGKEERGVAVKVMHPNVEDDIDADLDILRLSIRIIESIDSGPVRNLKWLNLPGFIEEMATMLKIQLDLRREGEHLVQFNKNFEGNQTIVFPKLVKGYEPTKRVLCETFCEGVPIMEFVKENKGDQKLLSNMCREAIKAICQMIFLDNFTHGDLHPGNVLVTDDYKFVLLDVGITTVHSETDHRLVSDVLAAFIRKNGRKAGRYMIDNSNSRLKETGDHALEEEEFIDRIEMLTLAASGKDYFMQHLGTYITYICNSASTHHVMLNQAFISTALAVKVQEGIALALDPSIEIWKIAIPIILEGERLNGRMGERAKEMLSIDGFMEWWTGQKTIRYEVHDENGPKGRERVVVYTPNQ